MTKNHISATTTTIKPTQTPSRRGLSLILGLLLAASHTLSANTKNICYRGQDPKNWSRKRKLEEFALGPCSPALLIPGISGSKLQVVINCKKLEKSHKKIFKTCKWSGCGFFDNSPRREYRLWIPEPLTPMSFVAIGKKCFSALMRPQYDNTGSKLVFRPLEGVRVRPYGATKETGTFKKSQCALKGVQDILPKPLPQQGATTVFKRLGEVLKRMGYEPGLTLQALPYDFRIANNQDPLERIYPEIVRKMKKLANKKVTVIAHSMGNLRTAHMLWEMQRSGLNPDEFVANFISLTGPFLGASESIATLTCGNDAFVFPLNIGIDFDTFWSSLARFSAILELTPYNTYTSQRGKPWLRKVLRRIDYEEGRSNDPVFDWLPTRETQCFPNFAQKGCRTGLTDYSFWGRTKSGEAITNDNLKPFMDSNTIEPNLGELWKVETRDSKKSKIWAFRSQFSQATGSPHRQPSTTNATQKNSSEKKTIFARPKTAVTR